MIQTPAQVGALAPRSDEQHRRAARAGHARPSTRGRSTDGQPLIVVRIKSFDAVAVLGVAAMLAEHPRIQVLEDTEPGRPDVVIQVSKRLSGRDISAWREQQRARYGVVDDSPVHHRPAVIAVTEHFEDHDLLGALDAGVSGVIRRHEVTRAHLASAVMAVADGAVLLPPRLQAMLVHHLRRVQTEVLAPNGLTISGLTARERDVLRLVAEGLDSDEIASRLAFSTRTVKYVLTHVMQRYGLRSRTHAVAFAIRSGGI